MDWSDEGSHSVNGKHPQGSVSDKTQVILREAAERGEDNLHAPSGKTADQKIFPLHIYSSLSHMIPENDANMRLKLEKIMRHLYNDSRVKSQISVREACHGIFSNVY
jgi:hypothetical protein